MARVADGGTGPDLHELQLRKRPILLGRSRGGLLVESALSLFTAEKAWPMKLTLDFALNLDSLPLDGSARSGSVCLSRRSTISKKVGRSSGSRATHSAAISASAAGHGTP